MKKICYLLFIIPTIMFAQEKGIQPQFTQEFTPKWERAKEYTLKVAEAMPNDMYQYRPTAEVFTFAGQMTHIMGNIYGLCSRLIKEDKNPYDYDYWVKNSAERTKEEIIAELNDAFDYAAKTLADISDEQLHETVQFQGPQLRKDIFQIMRNHATHHRAQCVMYLRMNGLKPPRGSWW